MLTEYTNLSSLLGMTGKQFTAWMKKNDLRVADVASGAKLDTNTVYAFRRDTRVSRTTRDLLMRFVQEYEASRQAKPEREAG
jgi:hypothetical protein